MTDAPVVGRGPHRARRQPSPRAGDRGAAGGGRGLLFVPAAGAGGPVHARASGGPGHRGPELAVLLCRRRAAVLRTGGPQRPHQADRRFGQRGPAGHGGRCACALRQRDLPRDVGRVGRHPDSAPWSGSSPGRPRSRRPSTVSPRRRATTARPPRRSACRRRSTACGGGLVPRQGPAARPGGPQARGAVERRRCHARARAARERLPGTPARDRLPRPRARRVSSRPSPMAASPISTPRWPNGWTTISRRSGRAG